MPGAIECHVPVTIRLAGEPNEETWSGVQDVLTRCYSDALARALAEARSARSAGPFFPARERFDPARSVAEGYVIPSYQRGVPVTVAAEPTSATARDDVFTYEGILYWLEAAFPATRGRPAAGIHYGAYVVLEGTSEPLLYYLAADPERGELLESIALYRRVGDRRTARRLPAGSYTLHFRAGSTGELIREGRRFGGDLENPGSLDVIVDFVVGEPPALPGGRPELPYFPVLRLLRRGTEEDVLATESEGVYIAAYELWETRPSGEQAPLDPALALAIFMGARVELAWAVHRIGREGRTLVTSARGRDPVFRHTWTSPGTFEVSCELTVTGARIRPEPVRDARREDVIELKAKLATSLATLERLQAVGQPIWPRRWGSEVVRRLEVQLAAETNPARQEHLREAIESARGKLEDPRYDIGPFPVRAVFMDRASSTVVPLKLFVAGRTTQTDLRGRFLHLWSIIDLTTPGAYAAYHGGHAYDDTEGFLSALEELRTSRNAYPPGHILAVFEWEGMEERGIRREAIPNPFLIETTSTGKTVKEIAGWTAAGLGVVALTLSGQGYAVSGLVVATGLIGAGLSVSNLHERISHGTFAWDVETFSDIVSIAGAIAAIGTARTAARMTSVLKATGVVEEVSEQAAQALARAALGTPGLVPQLARLLTVQKYFLYTGAALNVANGILVAASAVRDIERVDVVFDDAVKQRYFDVWGESEGLRRFREAREAYVLTVLARSALTGTLAVVTLATDVVQIQRVRTQQQVLARAGAEAEQMRAEIETLVEQGFGRAGLMVRLRAHPGMPHTVLEIGSGPTRTYLAVPEDPAVQVVRTDINPSFPVDMTVDARHPLPEALHGRFDTVIVNNPHGYKPSIADLAKALRFGGKIVIQGNIQRNPDFRAAIDEAATPPGMTRAVEFLPERDLPPEFKPWDRAAIEANIAGGPFSRTDAKGQVKPNVRVSYTLGAPLPTGKLPTNATLLDDALGHLQLVAPAQRAEALASYLSSFEKATGGSFSALRSELADGAVLFTQRNGDAVVIDPGGRVLRGNVLDPQQFALQRGALVPDYAKLTEVR